MKYSGGMNDERDPITEWEHAIYRRIGAGAVVCMITVFIGAMIAPIFGEWIKGYLYEYYCLYNDCEQRVKTAMKTVWICLWGLALVAWIIVFAVNLC
jgi:hypothetical protein